MKTHQEKVKAVCDKVYRKDFQQVTIDLIQDNIEEMLDEGSFTREDIGAAIYHCSILKEAMNPMCENDIELLAELEKELNDWKDSIEFVNIALGLPPNS